MNMLRVSASPHIKDTETTSSLMKDVLLSLLPAFVWSIYVFGFRALSVYAVSIGSAVLFEYLVRKLMNKNNTIGDCSAVVTGVLLAMSLPVSVPLWLPVIGSFFAIVIVKQLFGGLGKNVVNPAIAARVFLFASFPAELTAYTAPHNYLSFFKIAFKADNSDIAVAGATPLAVLKNGTLPTNSIPDMFFGNIVGCLGEVSAFLLIVGGIYLIAKKVITWHIPVCYMATVAFLTFVFSRGGMFDLSFMLCQLFTGGLVLGAFFMATDYVTSPATKLGRIIYAVGCGAITVFIRYFGGYPEGVSFAIMIMNLFVWYLDKATRPKVFGTKKGGKAHE